MSAKDSRSNLALAMVSILPAWGTWVQSLRDFDTPFGKIGYRQSSIMWELRHKNLPEDQHTATGIAAIDNVAPSVITRAADKLVAGGFVVREESERDGRKHLLRLTERGEAASIWIEELFLDAIQNQLTDLDDAEIATLVTSIGQIRGVLDRLQEKPLSEHRAERDEP